MNPILEDIGNFIFLEDKPQKADVIMIPGGSYPELPEIAANLWKSGYAPTILIGGRWSIKTGVFPGPRSKKERYFKPYETEYDFYKDVLLLNEVPESAILGENRSTHTRENALFAKETADEKNISPRKALLVCKAFHGRRCLMFYQSAFPETEFRIIPFPGFGIEKSNWFLTETGVQRVLGEVKRCGDQFTFEDIKNYRK